MEIEKYLRSSAETSSSQVWLKGITLSGTGEGQDCYFQRIVLVALNETYSFRSDWQHLGFHIQVRLSAP